MDAKDEKDDSIPLPVRASRTPQMPPPARTPSFPPTAPTMTATNGFRARYPLYDRKPFVWAYVNEREEVEHRLFQIEWQNKASQITDYGPVGSGIITYHDTAPLNPSLTPEEFHEKINEAYRKLLKDLVAQRIQWIHEGHELYDALDQTAPEA